MGIDIDYEVWYYDWSLFTDKICFGTVPNRLPAAKRSNGDYLMWMGQLYAVTPRWGEVVSSLRSILLVPNIVSEILGPFNVTT